MIKNGDLRMFNQDAKSILFWLLETKTKETSIELYKLYVNSSEWELEFREKKWS